MQSSEEQGVSSEVQGVSSEEQRGEEQGVRCRAVRSREVRVLTWSWRVGVTLS